MSRLSIRIVLKPESIMDDATDEDTDIPHRAAISGTVSDYGNNEWWVCNMPATSKPLAVRIVAIERIFQEI